MEFLQTALAWFFGFKAFVMQPVVVLFTGPLWAWLTLVPALGLVGFTAWKATKA